MTPREADAGVVLRLEGVTKRYAAPVLAGVDLTVGAGEVHALMGANGAGKSTLSRIVCGLTRPDAGTMALDGEAYRPRSRQEAGRAGVQLVMQELNLIPTLTVAENMFLADLPRRMGIVSTRVLRARAAEALAAVGLDGFDPHTPLGRLGVGQQQLLALAAALARPCRLLVLDEPTAALTDSEIDVVFARIRTLQRAGAGVLYISHRIDEIRRISDRITVLRDGRIVGTRTARDASMDDVVRLMVGERGVETLEEASHARDAVALRVRGLSSGSRVRDVSFDVNEGEIFGLAGLVGAGRSETLRAIFGADPVDRGHVSRGPGRPLVVHGPHDAVRAGIGMIPENRSDAALLLTQPVRVNITLAALKTFVRRRWWMDERGEARAAGELAARLDVRSRSLEQPASELSGGNQQKVIVARWLLRDCDVLLLDEPTRGIDVAAKTALYRVIHELAARGKAILVVSSELRELMALCDRIAVLSAGRLVATFRRGAWTEEAIVAAAFSEHVGRPERTHRAH